MSPSINDARNPNGTYNGVKLLAMLSGLSEAEIAWMAERLHFLQFIEGRSKEDAMLVVAEEAKAKPWEAKT